MKANPLLSLDDVTEASIDTDFEPTRTLWAVPKTSNLTVTLDVCRDVIRRYFGNEKRLNGRAFSLMGAYRVAMWTDLVIVESSIGEKCVHIVARRKIPNVTAPGKKTAKSRKVARTATTLKDVLRRRTHEV